MSSICADCMTGMPDILKAPFISIGLYGDKQRGDGGLYEAYACLSKGHYEGFWQIVGSTECCWRATPSRDAATAPHTGTGTQS